jgi:hypothetical protein
MESKIMERISKLDNTDLLEKFEKCIREGAGFISVPFLWYRKELLFRLEGIRQQKLDLKKGET